MWSKRLKGQNNRMSRCARLLYEKNQKKSIELQMRKGSVSSNQDSNGTKKPEHPKELNK